MSSDVPSFPEPDEEPLSALEVAYVVPAPAYETTLAISSSDAATATETTASVGPTAVLDALGGLESRLEAQLAPLHDLGRKLDQLQATLDREARAEATREKVVDRLHAELQEYKNDLLLKILRPVFIDLVQLHDDMGKMVEAQSESAGEVSRLLGNYQQGIEDILYRQGVEPFSTADDTFDPRRQRAVQTVATDEPDQNKRVAARLRKGFQHGDKVIRPELVSVYALKK